jgi:hypothetical protein
MKIHVSRSLTVLLALVVVVMCGVSAVYAQTRSTLPTSRSSAGDARANPAVSALPVPVSPFMKKLLPPWPARPSGKGTRRVKSASGGYIKVTTGTGCTEAAGSDIYPIGCQVTLQATSLPTSVYTYQDYVQSPNGTVSVATLGGTYTGNNDTTHALTFTTAGIYIMGALNVSQNKWDAVIYIAVGSPVEFDTYADSALTTPAQTLVVNGSNVLYLSASGLTPTDKYVYTVENTSDNGTCVFTAPAQASYTTTDLLCNPEAPGLSGTSPTPTNGTFSAQWQPTIGTPAALQVGTYSISLYDQTTHLRISQRQISLTAASGGPQALVTFYPGGTLFAGVAGETTPRIAYNGNGTGFADSAVTYVNVYNGGSGLTVGKSYKFTITDPQGNIVDTFTQTAAAGGTVPGSYNQYALPTTTAIPLATIAAGNVYTTQIFDTLANATVASQAWEVLNYSTLPTFNNGSNQLQASATNGAVTDATITFLNDGITRFGATNADKIAKIVAVTNTNFPTFACTTACPTTIQDSDHQTWNVTLTGGGATAYTLTLTAPTGTGLKPGSTLVMPLQITTGATSKCPAGTPCTITTQITPLHNGIASGTGNTNITSQMQVTDSGSDHSGTIVAEIVANTVTGTALQLAPQYTPYTNTHLGSYYGFPYADLFAANAYAAGQPYTTTGAFNIYGLAITNTSSNNAAKFYELALTLPPGIDATQVTTAGNSYVVEGVQNNTFTTTSCGGQNGLPANTVCISNWSGNSGTQIGQGGLFYCFLKIPQSSVAFPYQAIGGIIVNSDEGFGKLINLTADGTRDVFVPKTASGSAIPANSIAAYSLNAGEMLSTVTPGSLGTSLTNNVTLSFENTPYSSDPFPDYVDGVLIEVPTPSGTQPVSAISVQQNNISPAGWLFLNGNSSFVYGGNTYYWFGLCTNAYSTSYTLPDRISGTTRGGDAPASTQCSQTPNEQEALQPGQSLSVPLKVVTTNNAGAYTGYIFAHGANANGWSAGTAFTLNVATGTTASAGFSGLGTYNAANTTAALTPGQQPAIGGDSNTTYGNSYSYTVTNTGNNAIGKIDITIPGETSTGAAGADSSGVYPTLTGTAATATVAITGGNGSGSCTITNFTSSSSQTTNNGYIELGGTGCTLNPGDSITVSFSMKMPYRVNVVYAFPTTVYARSAPTTAVAAGETWVNDQTMTITNSAVLSVVVNSGTTCTGGTGSSVNTTLNLLNFGNIAASSTETCTQAVSASVWTPLSSPYGWSLYASIDSNPARTPATPTNEALMRYNATGSTLQDPAVSGGSTTYTVIPTSPGTAGFLVGKTSSSGTSTSYRTPFIFDTDYEISIGTETVTGQQHTLTFTWISN